MLLRTIIKLNFAGKKANPKAGFFIERDER